MLDIGGQQARAKHGLLDHQPAEFGGGYIFQTSAEVSDRGANRRHDYNIIEHGMHLPTAYTRAR